VSKETYLRPLRIFVLLSYLSMRIPFTNIQCWRLGDHPIERGGGAGGLGFRVRV
jgi:hypothetical protein